MLAVIAPDKFKGSLTALEAARAIERGLQKSLGAALETRIVPMADGGEGTVDAFVATGARRVTRTVRGPLGAEVEAGFALAGSTAIVEMAAASGLSLVAAEQRDPLRASSFGTGQLIEAALDVGAQHLVVGIGGSATNDGGAGLLSALGARFLDRGGRDLAPGGAALADLKRIDLSDFDPRIAARRIEVAADVTNPLTGASGASAVFGPQKGAAPAQVALLDAALTHFADVAAALLGRDMRAVPGAGAAGGVGFALLAFAGATLRPGVEIVAELRGLKRALEGAQWCLTGEGSIDAQTLDGKTVDGVARAAQAQGVRTIAFAGRVEPGAAAELTARGVTVIPLSDPPLELTESLRRAAELLEAAAEKAGERIGRGDLQTQGR